MKNVDDLWPMRLAAAHDALCIGVLGTQVFLDTYATDGIRPSLAREVLSQMSTAAIAASLAAPRTHFIVGERDGHMRAFAQFQHGATHELVGSRTATELKRLYVQEHFAAAGWGTALLRRAETLAAAYGSSTVWLTAWIGNSRALAFYARRGYNDVGATDYVFEGEHYENRVFVKNLKE